MEGDRRRPKRIERLRIQAQPERIEKEPKNGKLGTFLLMPNVTYPAYIKTLPDMHVPKTITQRKCHQVGQVAILEDLSPRVLR